MLSCDFARIKEEVEMINSSKADWFHIDVMDGKFVPNITFGFSVIEAMKRFAQKPLDVHLMIESPEKYINDFKNAGADIISVHVEACVHLHRVLQQIKQTGALAGVAINPHTSVETLKNVINDIDVVCMMSVNPGFGGQKFIPNTLNKIRELKKMILENNANVQIEIDGGVTFENYKLILEAGADILVAGNTIFKNEKPIEAIAFLKQI